MSVDSIVDAFESAEYSVREVKDFLSDIRPIYDELKGGTLVEDDLFDVREADLSEARGNLKKLDRAMKRMEKLKAQLRNLIADAKAGEKILKQAERQIYGK